MLGVGDEGSKDRGGGEHAVGGVVCEAGEGGDHGGTLHAVTPSSTL